MAQAGASKLKLIRSKRKRCKHHTLSFFYIPCAIGKLKKVNFDLVNQKQGNLKRIRALARKSVC